ncbi:MAG: ABC transporter ATP-binding protein [Halocynthiibacter sp.]
MKPASAKQSGIVLGIHNLVTEVGTARGPITVVDDVSFNISAGETLCIAGESGSGKSMASLSIMRLLPPSARVSSGRIVLQGRDLLKLSERQMQAVRGNEVAMIFQEPMTSLNPIMTIGAQLCEAIRTHHAVNRATARQKALETLDAARISDAARRFSQYPHELSGGMRQRVMIAMALAGNPKLLIADEPTTALDVTIQLQILALIDELKRDFNTAVMLITHDMGVVAEMADRVVIMKDGRLVEEQPAVDLFRAPKETYTRDLLAAVPRLGSTFGGPPPAPIWNSSEKPSVSVRDLTVRFDINGGLLRRPVKRVHAVENVSFDLFTGETLALVGESGSGKSTIGKALTNLVNWSGSISICGQEIRSLPTDAMNKVRRNIQLIFQDPVAALNPRMKAGDLVGEPLLIHQIAQGSEYRDRVAELFRRVGLDPDMAERHPHEFSGGQRQRICIARALSLDPKIIVADEPVSALDVSVQAQVLDLMAQLRDELQLSYLFISHDMAVVEQISHRVAVMYLGQIVEIGPRDRIFENPQHPYTKRLLEAVPVADPLLRRTRTLLVGDVPSPIQRLDYVPDLVDFTSYGDMHFAATGYGS